MHFNTHYAVTALVIFISVIAQSYAETSGHHTFLPRRARSQPETLIQDAAIFSWDEMEALNCSNEDPNDSEARFAIQYQVERESLRWTESGYLQMRRDQRPVDERIVVPVLDKPQSSTKSVPFLVA